MTNEYNLQIYRTGQKAALSGKTLLDNPYRCGTRTYFLYRSWCQGFRSIKKEKK